MKSEDPKLNLEPQFLNGKIVYSFCCDSAFSMIYEKQVQQL